MRSLLAWARIALGAAFLIPQTISAFAEEAQLERCKVGVYVVALQEFNVQKKSFDADLWFWSICAREQRQPLKSMEMVNAKTTTASLDSTFPRDDVFWSSRKVTGTFRHDWNVQNFPFDRHTLTVAFEEGTDDTRAFVYEPDHDQSGYDPKIGLPGWKITGFRLVSTEWVYPTTFGDPSLPPNSQAHFSRVLIELPVVRDSVTSFLKMVSVVYVAAMLALLSFFLDDRITFLGGTLLVTVFSMRTSSTELGSEEGVTLIDLIHISCLVLILVATILAIATRHLIFGISRSARFFLFWQISR